MTVNEDKTRNMNFPRKQQYQPSSNKEFVSDNKTPLHLSNVKLLGLITDENLIWVTEVNNVVKLLSNFVFILHKVECRLNVKIGQSDNQLDNVP